MPVRCWPAVESNYGKCSCEIVKTKILTAHGFYLWGLSQISYAQRKNYSIWIWESCNTSQKEGRPQNGSPQGFLTRNTTPVFFFTTTSNPGRVLRLLSFGCNWVICKLWMHDYSLLEQSWMHPFPSIVPVPYLDPKKLGKVLIYIYLNIYVS